jgi:ribosome-associated protein
MTEQPISDNLIQLAPGDPPITIHRDALRFTFARSSGPGGQSVNKLNTKAELRVAVGDIGGLSEQAAVRLRKFAGQKWTADDELLIQSDATRSQAKNRDDCIERLRELVLRAVTVPKKRKKTRPSKAAREKRLKAKREQSEKKQRRREPPLA